MKIAHIIPASIGYPLPTHNGRYDWVHELAKRQAQQGHSVTVYGSPDSFIEGVLTTGISQSADDSRQNNIETFRLAFRNTHDVYHSHFDNLHYAVALETDRPIVYTQHWWPTTESVHFAQTSSAQNVWAVPPTQFMYAHDQDVGIQSKGYIYHGIDLDEFHPSNVEKTDRLLCVSRISPEKKLESVIDFAVKTNSKLDIIGKITPKNQDYWQTLEPFIDGQNIRYLGTMDHDTLIDYYTSSRGVIFPFTENEAFGLVAIEAQACGTPVIMNDGGSRGELVNDGKSGFLCADEIEFTAAIKSLDTINPEDCIEFAKQFDISIMTNRYEQLYGTLITS